MEEDAALGDATDHFLQLLDLANETRLGDSTPCEEWSIRELVWHVTAASTMAIDLAKGCSRAEAVAAMSAPQPPDDELLPSCRRALGETVAALGGPIAPDTIVHHPVGDVPASQLLNFRIGDLVLHSWDLATALKVDATIPAPLAQRAYNDLSPMAPFIGSIGLFGDGPSGLLDDGADVAVLLLDLSGRRPSGLS